MKKLAAYILILLSSFSAYAQLPEVPQITSVSIENGQVVINWTISDKTNVDGYAIERQIFNRAGVLDGSFMEIASVTGPDENSYIDVSTMYGAAQPDDKSETYRIKAFRFDGSGGKEFSPQTSDPHSTIHLFEPEFEACLEEVTLKWNPYKGWGGRLSSYIVYARAEGSLNYEQLSATISPDDTTYIHNLPETNVKYTYYISAIKSGEVPILRVNSGTKTVETPTPEAPAVFNADQATINRSGNVEVSFTVGRSDDIKSYTLARTTDISVEPKTIHRFDAGPTTLTYEDLAANPDVVNYYRLTAVGVCDKDVGQSNWAQNITLNASILSTSLTEGITQLEWTPYDQWNGVASEYSLYRQIDNGAFEEHIPLPTHQQTGQDFISLQEQINGKPLGGKFCYYVKVKERNNPQGIVGESVSAIKCVYFKIEAEIPNAINPISANVENRVFKPVVNFATRYNLVIFNRWGNLIFRTNDVSEGWNGTDRNGRIAQKGTYIYLLEYQDAKGVWYKNRGQVNVFY